MLWRARMSSHEARINRIGIWIGCIAWHVIALSMSLTHSLCLDLVRVPRCHVMHMPSCHPIDFSLLLSCLTNCNVAVRRAATAAAAACIHVGLDSWNHWRRSANFSVTLRLLHVLSCFLHLALISSHLISYPLFSSHLNPNSSDAALPLLHSSDVIIAISNLSTVGFPIVAQCWIVSHPPHYQID